MSGQPAKWTADTAVQLPPPPAPREAAARAPTSAPAPAAAKKKQAKPARRGRAPGTGAGSAPGKRQPSRAESPQLALMGLLAGGHGERKHVQHVLVDNLGLTRQQVYQALHQATTKGRVVREGDTYMVTAVGSQWLADEIAAVGPPATMTAAVVASAPSAPAQRARRRVAATSADQPTNPVADQAAPSAFRCAVFSDGTFQASKADQALSLSPEELRYMVRYLKCLGQLPTAVAAPAAA